MTNKHNPTLPFSAVCARVCVFDMPEVDNLKRRKSAKTNNKKAAQAKQLEKDNYNIYKYCEKKSQNLSPWLLHIFVVKHDHLSFG